MPGSLHHLAGGGESQQNVEVGQGETAMVQGRVRVTEYRTGELGAEPEVAARIADMYRDIEVVEAQAASARYGPARLLVLSVPLG
jgi:hypothetical protein